MKIAILGYGKMGREIEKICIDRGHSIELRVSSKDVDFDDDALRVVDVAIEFSTPESAIDNIQKCIESQTPVVVGTTGWYNHFNTVSKQVEKADSALFYATNFSVGVNVFFEINKKLAELMKGYSEYDVEVEETHHTEKKDAPSGTAITIAEGILTKLNNKKQWVNEASDNKDDLSVVSHRVPDVPGTHIVKYTSDIDDIEIKHTAHNRSGFAMGAVLAAEWILGKKGVFTMNDLLDI